MHGLLEKLGGIAGVGLTWGILWAVLALILGTIIAVIDPGSIDPGEEPIVLAPIIGLVGLACGAAFAILVSILEGQRTISNLPVGRAVAWGILVAAALPVVAGKDVGEILILGPVGAISAAASVAVLRKWMSGRNAFTSPRTS